MTDARGFTLVEILVAIAIAGLLTSGVYLALDRVAGASERNRQVQERARHARNARSVLTALLRGARPERGIDAFRGLDGGDVPSGSDELRFRSALGVPFAGLAAGEPLRVRVRLREAEPAGVVLEVAPASSLVRYPTKAENGTRVLSTDPGARVDTLLLFPGARSLEASYRGTDGRWRDAWRQAGSLPSVVRLILGTASRELPPVYVAPRSGRHP